MNDIDDSCSKEGLVVEDDSIDSPLDSELHRLSESDDWNYRVLRSKRREYLIDLQESMSIPLMEMDELLIDQAASIYLEEKFPESETYDDDVLALKRSLLDVMYKFRPGVE